MSETLESRGSSLSENLPRPARRALEEAGVTSLEQLAALSESDIKRLHGMGPKTLDLLRRALAAQGLAFAAGEAGRS